MPLTALQVVWAWSLQAAVVVAAGMLVALLLRWRADPRARLVLWRLVLTIAVLLPLVGIAVPPPAPVTVGPFATVPGVTIATWEWGAAAARSPAVLATLLLVGLAAGALWRVTRLVTGALALRRFARAEPVLDEDLESLAIATGVRARLVAAPVAQPFTFGLRRPVIVVPLGFAGEPAVVRRAVLAHELSHVRRRDWVHAVVEDACAALLWFHPGIWLALDELRLAREEIVDRAAARLVGSRRAYVETLLAFTSARSATVQPASGFFRHRQLARRIAALSREVSMSTRVLVGTGVTTMLVLLAVAAAVQAAFPLPAAPAQATAAESVSALEELAYKVPQDAPPPRKVHDVRPAYPDDVREVVTSAVFGVRVVVDVDGTVAEARILTQRFSGPGASPDRVARAVARLADGTLAAVRQWRFEPPEKAPLALTLALSYHADGPRTTPPPPPPPPPPPASVIVAPVAKHEVRPVFPEDARRAGDEGVVQVSVTVGSDGAVTHASVTQSHPAFDAAALEAARQWTFHPGTRNGRPVAVETELTFAFYLRD